MRILVLGGYGFIGAALTRALAARGYAVLCLGRSQAAARRLVPEAAAVKADLARLLDPSDWACHVEGCDAVVNAAGALQDGPRDRLGAVHDAAVRACLAASAAAGVRRFVQISAPGARADASTVFLRTKSAGDSAVRASALEWTILKPGLVIGRDAFGGTALLRLLAGVPGVQPLAYPDAPIQTVFIDDLAAAVAAAVEGRLPARADYDLVADAPVTLREAVRALRERLGFAPARFEIAAAPALAAIVGRVADFAGLLGWRSPLRTTAMRVIAEGVVGDPSAYRAATGHGVRSFAQSLRMLTPTAQERVYARTQALLPLVVVTLAMFWIVSGLVGFARADAAAALLRDAPPDLAKAAVLSGATADVAIGIGLLIRRTARAAALAAAALSAAYLAAGSALEPALWADPLGPYVKIAPALALAIVAAALLGDR